MAVSIFTGSVFNFGNVMSGIFSPYGRDPSDVAMIGVTALLGGFIGATVGGIILDKTSAYKKSIQVNILVFLINSGFMIFITLS